MTKVVQQARNSQAIIAAKAGAPGQLSVALETTELSVHDGVTLGGHPVAKKADMVARTTIATQEQAEAGTNDTAMMTPLKTKQAVDKGLEDFEVNVTAGLADDIATNAAAIVATNVEVEEVRALVADNYQLKPSVRCMAITNVNVATALEAGDTLSGLTLVAGDDVFLNGQTDPDENTVWVVQASGAAVRRADLDSEAELLNARFHVRGGTVNPGTTWQLITEAPITVGTTALVWGQTGSQSVIDGEVADARGPFATLEDRHDSQDARIQEVRDLVLLDGVIGTGGTLVTGTGIGGVRTVAQNSRAVRQRQCYELNIFNGTGVVRTVTLRRMVQDGANLVTAAGNVDREISVPAASPPAAIALDPPFLVEPGEYLGLVNDTSNSYTYLSATPNGTGYFFAVGDVGTVPLASLNTTQQLQFGVKYLEPAFSAESYRELAASVAANAAQIAALDAALFDPFSIGNDADFEGSASLAAGAWLWKAVATEKRTFNYFRTRNNTDAARSVTLKHMRIQGSNYVKVPGSTDLTFSIPAGPGDNDGEFEFTDFEFIQEVGEAILFASTTAGWTTFISNVDPQQGGLYYNGSAAAETIPITGDTNFDDLRLMVELRGFIRASDRTVAPPPSEGVTTELVLSVETSDVLGVIGNSYTHGYAALEGKSWAAKCAAQCDWVIENYGLSGSTATQRAAAIRANTIINGNALGPQDYGMTQAIIGFGRNDSVGITIPNFQWDMVQLHESVVNLLGAVPHYMAEVADAYGSPADAYDTGTGDDMLIKAVAEQVGAGFINAYQTGRRLGRAAGNPYLWTGSHPGTRTNEVYRAPVSAYIDTLGRPRQSMKIFRPREGASVSSPSDLYFFDNFDRERLWKEIRMGCTALADERFYDRLDIFPDGQTNTVRASEWLSFKAGGALLFNGYGLFFLVLPYVARNMANVVWQMDNIGADVYIPDGGAGAFVNGEPVGDWQLIGSSGGGLYPISAPQLRKGMRFDVLPVLIRKTGDFTLTRLCSLRYEPRGPEKPQPRIRDRSIRALGDEMLTNTTFPDDDGAPDGFTVVGDVVGTTTEDAVEDGSHLPYGAEGAITLEPGKELIASPTYTADPTESRLAQFKVVCRRKVPLFDYTDEFASAPITTNSFDRTKVRITQTDDTVGDVTAMQWLPVGLWWEELVFEISIPAGTTTIDIAATADAPVEAVIVSCRPFVTIPPAP